jgi:hypothetical protein
VDIEFRRAGARTWIAEVWSDDTTEPLVEQGFKEPYPEDTYQEINQWCFENFGYLARTAYHVFEFRKQSHLEWFILRWS